MGRVRFTSDCRLPFVLALLLSAISLTAQDAGVLPTVPTPADVKPGSINCEECPYPHPSKYLDIQVYTQDARIAYIRTIPNGNGGLLLLPGLGHVPHLEDPATTLPPLVAFLQEGVAAKAGR